MTIKRYKNIGTRNIAEQENTKASRSILPESLAAKALEKLVLLDAAKDLRDLLLWPSLRLEKLKGDRAGCYSIRINQKYRICFRWDKGNADDVEIVDYH